MKSSKIGRADDATTDRLPGGVPLQLRLERSRAADAAQRLLIEGETCWRRVHAERAAVLIDAADYFAALRSSLLKAQRSVFILGWELNSRTRLEGRLRPTDRAPVELGKFLRWLLKRRPHSRSAFCFGTTRFSMRRSASSFRAGSSVGAGRRASRSCSTAICRSAPRITRSSSSSTTVSRIAAAST